MEQSLDDIAEGKAEYLAVIIAAHAQLEQELATVTKATAKPVKCGKPMVHRVKKPGKEGRGGYDFGGCSGCSECDGK